MLSAAHPKPGQCLLACDAGTTAARTANNYRAAVHVQAAHAPTLHAVTVAVVLGHDRPQTPAHQRQQINHCRLYLDGGMSCHRLEARIQQHGMHAVSFDLRAKRGPGRLTSASTVSPALRRCTRQPDLKAGPKDTASHCRTSAPSTFVAVRRCFSAGPGRRRPLDNAEPRRVAVCTYHHGWSLTVSGQRRGF